MLAVRQYQKNLKNDSRTFSTVKRWSGKLLFQSKEYGLPHGSFLASKMISATEQPMD